MSELQTVSASQLSNLTPMAARELVVECFFQAQKETFRRAAVSLRQELPSDEELRKTVEGAVRFAFRGVKADFENPTRQTLLDVVSKLADRAAAMGTPVDIVSHHKDQMVQVFAALKD